MVIEVKVKNLNKSSFKTRKKIKETFAVLMKEKKQINKIKVVDLVKVADITRSSFYNHYDSIYDVETEIENDFLELINFDSIDVNSLESINIYVDELIDRLIVEEEFYKMLMIGSDSSFFLNKLNKLFIKKLYDVTSNLNFDNKELFINFYVDGCMSLFIRFFKGEISQDLNDIRLFIKRTFEKMFEEIEELTKL